jgi:hypothetical protein
MIAMVKLSVGVVSVAMNGPWTGSWNARKISLSRKVKGSRMGFRQVVAGSLAVMLAVGASPLLAQQQGSISGRAVDEAERPYNQFTVRIVRPETGELVSSQVLDSQGLFSIGSLPVGPGLLVQLIDTSEDNEVVCTEGPFTLTQSAASLADVNIECGAPPAALWLIAGAAGLVTAVGVLTTQDESTGTAGIPTATTFSAQSNSQ